MAQPTPATGHRRAMIAKVKIGQKALGWDDDAYRDILDGRYGKRSATKLTDAELDDLIKHMRASGFKPVRRNREATTTKAAKITALWIACYWLGVVRFRDDKALAAFVKRQTGVERPEWLPAGGARKVIEALKAMAERDGGVDWTQADNPRACVILAQWRRLGELGVLRVPTEDALSKWLMWKVTPNLMSVRHLTNGQADNAIRRLGRWLRRELDK